MGLNNINPKSVLIFLTRHTILIFGIIGLLWLVFSVFYGLFWDFLFAVISVIFAEFLAIALSNLALFLYTHISFTRGIFYGSDDKMNSTEQAILGRVIGQIFISVHILTAIVISLLYWGKIG